MMTYKQFYELASIERGRIKDPLHKHEKKCTEFYRHPVQTILVSLNLFSLCSVWTKECDMAIEPLEEQWCFRKMQKIIVTQEKDYAQYQRFKEHMAKLSQQSITKS